MLIRRTLRPVDGRPEAVLIVQCADGPRACGKFIVGRDREDPRHLVAVFDDGAAFHRDLAETYGLRPLGGGWCELDHVRRQVVLSGHSAQFGREPDRELVLALFGEVFAGYHCWRQD
jgi:hypothetical protein